MICSAINIHLCSEHRLSSTGSPWESKTQMLSIITPHKIIILPLIQNDNAGSPPPDLLGNPKLSWKGGSRKSYKEGWVDDDKEYIIMMAKMMMVMAKMMVTIKMVVIIKRMAMIIQNSEALVASVEEMMNINRAKRKSTRMSNLR